jgi:hypothetical protein
MPLTLVTIDKEFCMPISLPHPVQAILPADVHLNWKVDSTRTLFVRLVLNGMSTQEGQFVQTCAYYEPVTAGVNCHGVDDQQQV